MKAQGPFERVAVPSEMNESTPARPFHATANQYLGVHKIYDPIRGLEWNTARGVRESYSHAPRSRPGGFHFQSIDCSRLSV